jgi:predicted metal-binding membrane protein
MHTTKRSIGAFAAALIALLMLTYASILSSVMQVEMALPGGMTPLVTGPPAPAAMPNMDMPGMSMESASPTPHHAAPKGDHGHQSDCPYCAAAAHLAILGGVTPVLVSVAFVFAAFHLTASHGPRGPPELQPRARGPPSDPMPA